MRNISRRRFLNGLAALAAALPLAGKLPKQDEELGEIDLSGVLESSEQPLTVEESKYADNPYFWDGGSSMRTTFLSPDGKGGYTVTHYEDWIIEEEDEE